MFFKNPVFAGSFTDVGGIPKTGFPEFAFVGRSNVGKSTLINFLTNKKNLARTSQTPGKTQLLNYFLIDEKWYLVDLPGYGFAKVPKGKRDAFKKMMRDYLEKSENLQCVLLLIDARVPPQKADLDFVNYLGENRLPFVLVFTKADKFPSREFSLNIEAFKKQMLEKWEELPEIFITSAEKQKGREELVGFIENVLGRIA